MKFPDMPRDGVPVAKTVTEIINYIRSTRVVNVMGGRLKQSANGTTIEIQQGASNRTVTATGHPWKVTPNGDEFVSVNKGEILSLDHQDVTDEGASISNYFHFKKVMAYAGSGETPIEVTGNGFIYGEVPFIEYRSTAGGVNLDPGGTPTLFWLISVIPNAAEAIEVKFGAALPTPASGTVFIFEIARVTLTDGIAAVDQQTLRHDPTLVTYALAGGAASPP